jgi:5-formyltetrahydrofolate cyclo-ligase
MLRQRLRLRRAALTPLQRAAASRAITAHVAATRWLAGRRRVGLYVSVGSEVSTEPLRALARRRGCPVYLPRIVDYRRHRMVFARESAAAGAINRLGIPEPDAIDIVPARGLSVVFVPVLGIDGRGTRLGYGGGYYDRLFGFRRHRQSWHRPLLIGLAYACQQLPALERRGHDVPLDALVTEHGISLFTPTARLQ